MLQLICCNLISIETLDLEMLFSHIYIIFQSYRINLIIYIPVYVYQYSHFYIYSNYLIYLIYSEKSPKHLNLREVSRTPRNGDFFVRFVFVFLKNHRGVASASLRANLVVVAVVVDGTYVSRGPSVVAFIPRSVVAAGIERREHGSVCAREAVWRRVVASHTEDCFRTETQTGSSRGCPHEERDKRGEGKKSELIQLSRNTDAQ